MRTRALLIFGLLLFVPLTACKKPLIIPAPPILPAPLKISGTITDETGRQLVGLSMLVETPYQHYPLTTSNQGGFQVSIPREDADFVKFTVKNAIGDTTYYRASREELSDGTIDFVMDQKGSIRPLTSK